MAFRDAPSVHQRRGALIAGLGNDAHVATLRSRSRGIKSKMVPHVRDNSASGLAMHQLAFLPRPAVRTVPVRSPTPKNAKYISAAGWLWLFGMSGGMDNSAGCRLFTPMMTS